MTQLEIGGNDALAPPEAKLTQRQRIALEYIGHHQPVSSDELGAMLHEERRARGLKGHSSDERCEYCTDEGRSMGAALRQKGLVRFRRHEGGGWYIPSAKTDGKDDEKYSAQLSDTDDDWGGF